MPDIQILLETESRENMGFLANGCDSTSLAPKCFNASGLNKHFSFEKGHVELHTGNKVREEVRYKDGRMSLFKFLKRQPMQYPDLYSW